MSGTSVSMTAAEDGYREMQQRVEGTNIDPTTLLATDYLNHLNEAVMMLEMVPASVEFLEDAAAWQPKSYAEHFRDSGLTYGELAVEAYDCSPEQFRVPFDRTISDANQQFADAITALETAAAAEEIEKIALIVEDAMQSVRTLIDRAGAIIHGQGEDSVTAGEETDGPEDAGLQTLDQDAIDSLFD